MKSPKKFKHPRSSLVRMTRTLASLVSLVLHLGLLLILAYWIYRPGAVSQAITVCWQAEPLQLAAPLEVASASSDPWDAPPMSDSPARLEQIDDWEIRLTNLWDSTNFFDWIPSDPASEQPRLTGVIAGNGDLAEPGRGQRTGTTFFGTHAYGSRFVYVLDSSWSMRGLRWQLARDKLLESLKTLGAEREFFVICFDHQTTLLFNSSPAEARFYKADRSTIQRVERWLRSKGLGESTMPAEALQLAIRLSPDAIFFLSDGELRDHSLAMLRLINSPALDRRQIPIHVIHLMSPLGAETMSLLAEENGGTFTYIGQQPRRWASRR